MCAIVLQLICYGFTRYIKFCIMILNFEVLFTAPPPPHTCTAFNAEMPVQETCL